jgi:integrase/recombinase XerD
MIRIVAALDKYGIAGSRNRRRMRALVLLLRWSGLRISDAVTLSVERVNAGRLFLYTAKTGTPVWVPLPPETVMALEAALEPGSRYYFWTGNGKPKSVVTDWQEKLKHLFQLAQVGNGHAHRFRDTFAVQLLLARKPLADVAALLGHSSIKITERHYSPWVSERQEQLEQDVRSTWDDLGSANFRTNSVQSPSTRPN